MSEKDKKIEGYNTKEDSGIMRDPMNITSLRVCFSVFLPFYTIIWINLNV